MTGSEKDESLQGRIEAFTMFSSAWAQRSLRYLGPCVGRWWDGDWSPWERDL